MKKENLDKYEVFYMELPQADYLRDIEIQDEYDDSDDTQGLSENQVNALAEDSLGNDYNENHRPDSSEEQSLFTEGQDKQ